MEEIKPDDSTVPKRPQLLTFLCVLTFIASGFGVLGYFIIVLFGKDIKIILENSPDTPEEALANIAMLDNTSLWVVSFLLAFLSLFGAIKMFKLKKIGFHLYAISNILISILPLIYGMQYSSFALLSTAAFIGMYAMHLKHME